MAMNLAISYAPYVVMLTMGGVPALIGGVSLLYGAVKTMLSYRRYKRDAQKKIQGLPAPCSKIKSAFDRVKNSMGIKKDIPLRVSNVFDGSCAVAEHVILGESYTPEQAGKGAEFVMAHELAHLKNKDTDLTKLADIPMQASYLAVFSSMAGALGFLTWDILVTGGMQSATKAMVSLCGLAMVNTLAQPLLRNTFERTLEFRADRDAICATQDAIAAYGIIKKTDRQSHPKSIPVQRCAQFFSTHPVEDLRVRRIQKVFQRGKSSPHA